MEGSIGGCNRFGNSQAQKKKKMPMALFPVQTATLMVERASNYHY